MLKSFWDDIVHQFRMGSVIIRLIIICIAVFISIETLHIILWSTQQQELYISIYRWVALPYDLSVLLTRPWTIITYMFIHADVWHILYNMLWLYWFGEIYQLYMRERRALAVFFGGGLAGAALSITAYHVLPPLRPLIPAATLVGASAGIEAIMFAATALNPEHRIRLFLIGEVPLKFVAIAVFILNYVTITYGNAGGEIAHIGGAIFGFTYIKSLQAGHDWFSIFDWLPRLFSRSGRNMKATHVSRGAAAAATKSERPSSEQKRLDEILDKISKSGYNSLSKEEKDFLFKYSNK